MIITHEFGSGIGAGHCHLLKGLDPAWPWQLWSRGKHFLCTEKCLREMMFHGFPWEIHSAMQNGRRVTAALCIDSLLCFLTMVVVTSHQRISILSLQLIIPSPSTCQIWNQPQSIPKSLLVKLPGYLSQRIQR